jgi:hypothetical protein
MNIRTLLQFLDALSVPVQAVGGDPQLGGVRGALQPFAELSTLEFASFLNAAEQYRREDVVSVPNPALETVSLATQAIAANPDSPQAEQAFAEALAALGADHGIKVTAKADAKLKAKIRLDQKLASIEQEVRTLALHVKAPEDYARSEIVVQFDAARPLLAAAEWKALAQRFGVVLRGKSDPLTAIITHLSTIAPPAPGKASKAKAAADPEIVRLHATRLRELSERSVKAENLSLAQIDVEVAKFESLTEPTLKEVVKESGLPIRGSKKKDLIVAIRRHLDAAHRAKAEVAV